MFAAIVKKERVAPETPYASSQSTIGYLQSFLSPSRGKDTGVRSLAQRVTHEWTRDEVSLVCELLNQGDPVFKNALAGELEMQSGVGCSVLAGFKKGAGLLSEAAASELLGMVKNQPHRKEVQDLAIALLGAPQLATSLGVVTRCGEALRSKLSNLGEEQWDKIILRANSYPIDKCLPLPVGQAADEESNPEQTSAGIDVAGAVCVLMLAEATRNPSSNYNLLEQGLRLARQHPLAENLWLKPLATHFPEGLDEWKRYVGGAIPFSQRLQAFTKAAVATLLPTGLFMGTGFAAGRPVMLAGPVEPLVLLSIGAYYGSKILDRSTKQIQERVEKFKVPDSQKKQILACEIREV